MNLKMRIRSFILCLILFISADHIYAQFYWADLKREFTKEQLAMANTAKKVTYMSNNEKKVIQYLNLARMFPSEFASFYKAYIMHGDSPFSYYGKQFKRKDYYCYSLYKDLLKLNNTPQLPLQPDPDLQVLARCWAKESGRTGKIGHNRKRCHKGYFAECCGYAWTTDPMYHVLLLLVDKDVRSLGHREIMLGSYQLVGCSLEDHKGYGKVLVLDFK